MNLLNKINDQFDRDFDLDEDDCCELMGAVVKLFDNTTFDNRPCNQITKDLIALALTYGQPTIGGSRCDYAISDFLNAVGTHYQITSIKANYIKFLKEGIRKYALNPGREYQQLSEILKQLGK